MNQRFFSTLFFCFGLCAACLLSACGEQTQKTATPGTTIYFNANIVTVDDALPSAAAMAVENGSIIAVGKLREVESIVGGGASLRDMHGKTIVPGFIDAHGHFSYTSALMEMANLQPEPAGPVKNMADIQRILTDHMAKTPDANWVVGWGYDDSLLEEKRHPTRADLDAISTDRPIFINHVSGHLSVCNSKCLELAGIDASTEPPAGGVIRKDAETGIPTGVLEETASSLVQPLLPRPTPEASFARLEAVQNYYAEYGVTTVQDGGLPMGLINMLRSAAEQNLLFLDLVGFLRLPGGAEFPENFAAEKDYKNHFRVGGIKLVLDGSPQGKTAWLTEPYHIAPHGQTDDYVGYPIFEDDDVTRLITGAFERNIPVMAHANGDAAADQLINSVNAANAALGNADRRTVMIHAQTARDDQIDQMKTGNIIPSYFVAHTFYWGDWHRDSVFGETRASRISPLRATLDRGVPFTTHNDTPVVPSDMLQLIWSGVNRITRSGQTLGPEQRISPLEALKSVTLNAAYQMFEEEKKGSITAGKIADFVVLNENPLTVEPEAIKNITILETVKGGKTVYLSEPVAP